MRCKLQAISVHRRLHSDRFSKRLTVGIAGTLLRRIRLGREGGPER